MHLIPDITRFFINFDYTIIGNSVNSIFGVLGVGAIISIITILKTRPNVHHKTTDDFFHYVHNTRITHLDLELKFANNPLFKKFKLFTYPKPQGTFVVGGLLVPIPDNIYDEKLNADTIEVHVKEKSILKHNRTTHLKVELVRTDQNLQGGITHDIVGNKITVINKNEIPVKFYKIKLPANIPTEKIEELKTKSIVDEIYPEDGDMYMALNEISGKGTSTNNETVIRF
jgi:hypothetical protein